MNPSPSNGKLMELKKEILDILRCPKCKGNLEYGEKENLLKCIACGLGFRFKDGIPFMLINEAIPISD